MVTKKVIDRSKSNRFEDKDTSDQIKKITKTEDMFKARLLNGYSNPECQSYAIKNKNKAKDTKGKSLLINDHNSVESIHVQTSDFMEGKNDEKTNRNYLQTEIKDVVTSNVNQLSDLIENKIELEQVSLAPVKSSESYPAQVGNEKGSEIAPAQTGDDLSSILYFDALENDSNTSIEVDHDLPPLSENDMDCLLYTSPSPRDISGSRMPSSA